MTYPCEIIKDLLPLYIDDVCNEESRQAVKKHLAKCKVCREYYEAMKSTVDVVKITDNSVEAKKVNSLKKVKNILNRKINKIILSSVTAVLIIILGFYLLFFAPIRNVPIEDISVSVDVYSAEELLENHEAETTDIYIPEHDRYLTASAVAKFSYVSVMTITSDCFLRTFKAETKDNVIYVTAVRTTLLNSAGNSVQMKMCRLEHEAIDKVVFVDNSGAEIVLWSK